MRYVTDQKPGIRRRRAGKGFAYRNAVGRLIRDRATCNRVRALVIPPAWTDVWICSLPNGHLQATGRDVRGRKQYLYHERWRVVRDEAKFGKVMQFALALPALRRRVKRDLALKGVSRQKVLACIIWLLETTLIRVGNEEYARDNGSFGLTTFRNHHALVNGENIRFRFRGKSGKSHTVNISDQRIARVVKRCQELPGHELFAYLDENDEPHEVHSEDVNEYLRESTGGEFTAKDFRTWAATLLTAQYLGRIRRRTSAVARKEAVTQAIQSVAARLGNTASVCRKSYIHPRVIEGFQDRSLAKSFRTGGHGPVSLSRAGLLTEELALIRFLSRGPIGR